MVLGSNFNISFDIDKMTNRNVKNIAKQVDSGVKDIFGDSYTYQDRNNFKNVKKSNLFNMPNSNKNNRIDTTKEMFRFQDALINAYNNKSIDIKSLHKWLIKIHVYYKTLLEQYKSNNPNEYRKAEKDHALILRFDMVGEIKEVLKYYKENETMLNDIGKRLVNTNKRQKPKRAPKPRLWYVEQPIREIEPWRGGKPSTVNMPWNGEKPNYKNL